MARKDTPPPCRRDDFEARLAHLEEVARSNRRELDIQFRRIADLQAALDSPMVNGRRKRDSEENGDGEERRMIR